jgi:hypothetical protein
LGPHIESMERNANGERLIQYCMGNDLKIVSSWYPPVSGVGTGTWHCRRHPGVYNATLDHILMARSDMSMVKACGIDPLITPLGDTDHRAPTITLAVRGVKDGGEKIVGLYISA